MSSYLDAVEASDFILYSAVGQLDGADSAVSALPFRNIAQISCGPMHLNLSISAARALVEHMQAAIEALEASLDQQGGEA